jgi:uncharacterized cupin superfamily protein
VKKQLLMVRSFSQAKNSDQFQVLGLWRCRSGRFRVRIRTSNQETNVGFLSLNMMFTIARR